METHIDPEVVVKDDVQAVTGAPPTSFTEFARRTASAWAVRVAE